MKALQLEKPQHWRAIDIPEPKQPGEGEALVRVRRIGICGTDIAGFLGKMPFFSYPRIPGHELGVEVVTVGASVGGGWGHGRLTWASGRWCPVGC